MPVWIIISFLGAFVTSSLATTILTRVNRLWSNILIGLEQIIISWPNSAWVIIFPRFMTTTLIPCLIVCGFVISLINHRLVILKKNGTDMISEIRWKYVFNRIKPRWVRIHGLLIYLFDFASLGSLPSWNYLDWLQWKLVWKHHIRFALDNLGHRKWIRLKTINISVIIKTAKNLFFSFIIYHLYCMTRWQSTKLVSSASLLPQPCWFVHSIVK